MNSSCRSSRSGPAPPSAAATPSSTQAYQGGVFPAGLPIGVVERVDPAGAATLVPRVAVRPYAALGSLDMVAVVLDPPARAS